MADSVVKEPISGTGPKEMKFPGARNELALVNDSGSTLTFTVNDDTYTLGAAAIFDEELDPFESVIIDASGAYYGFVRRSKTETR